MSSADEWLRSAFEENERMLQQATTLQEAISGARGTARSADGMVSATVAPGGALVSLDLHERAVEMGSRRLQAAIVETIHRANADAAAKLEELVRPVVGDRFDDAMAAAQAQMPPVPGLPERPAAPRRGAEHAEDDDLSEQTVLRSDF
ncbi:YbaB/EbfC DNA-binding family protein [Streptoalloteichus tenebrarius]|uniref:YbaB/EbfC DNA-binding family protein n=1 Tax=Streptoalloteichus tenebrarius (strain ATCC 17920 / DSM 40477 / JCM 4838 / CBS 697.72 / NBRC 16177 / NCIMB 11028 / NRRL B-12390 / A12253. 1 / ISP 5477) TaxID=1933 RepID=A0ABT1HQH8_STRSD|nr:YbaB/EbfC family nucleoid-associated protein [Streptoalloteichus tenebrarius]MCP2257771.1 YbaB/EbfC DNA-binding family protein [Streptoalloteichus tenebrarius]